MLEILKLAAIICLQTRIDSLIAWNTNSLIEYRLAESGFSGRPQVPNSLPKKMRFRQPLCLSLFLLLYLSMYLYIYFCTEPGLWSIYLSLNLCVYIISIYLCSVEHCVICGLEHFCLSIILKTIYLCIYLSVYLFIYSSI